MPKLTKRTIDGLTPGDKDQIIFDEGLKGFGVRLAPTGRKTYLVQYRAGGRTRRVKLGLVGALTPDEARKLAKNALGAVARGQNPAEEIRLERRAPTMGALCDRFLAEHVEQRLKPTTQREYRRCIDLFIRPAFGTFKVADVARADVATLHHELRDRPYQANRVLGVLSKLFNLAEIWGLRAEGTNPTRLVPKYREQKRERYLTVVELQRLNDVLTRREADGLETPFVVAAFRLLILTGCRLTEIQRLKWDFIEGPMMCLPDTKTGRRRIPLPPLALDILEALPRTPENPFVIAGDLPGAYVTDLQKPWRRIRVEAELEDVRIHDLRHTYASQAVQNGLDIVMVGKLLGHTQLQTTMRYAHLADEPVRRAAERVSDLLASAMTPMS